jgi:hypothetical protein
LEITSASNSADGRSGQTQAAAFQENRYFDCSDKRKALQCNGGTKVKTRLALITAATLFVLVASAYAHHPFAAEYDWTKPVTLTGTVNKVEWSNPHAMLYMDAKDESGKMQKWTLEMGSPSALTRAGWNRNTLKMGDQITVDAWLSKSKGDRANVKSVKLADGHELSGGSSIVEIKQAKNTKPISN